MAKLNASRSAQYPLFQDFTFNFSDYVTDSVDGVKKTLGATTAVADPASTVSGLTGPVANTIVFDCIPLPLGAVVTGGELIVETAYAGCTAATVLIGIAGATSTLLGSTSLMATAGTRTSLLLTSVMQSNSGANVRATIAYTVANATAGKCRIRVMYTVDNRANENQIT